MENKNIANRGKVTTALLVRANGHVQHIHLPVIGAHFVICHLLGGWFSVVKHRTQPDLHAYVIESDSLIKEPNIAVGYLFEQIIPGDVILSRSTPDGSEADFMLDDDMVEIYKLLNTDETRREFFRDKLTWPFDLVERN